MRTKILLVCAGALVLAITATTAIAGHIGGTVKSYTGCLATSGGTLSLIKEGDAPQRACPSGSTEAHFSGGDITSITAGKGLTGTAATGAATLSIRQDCASGKILKWNGSDWACADDSNSTYTAGTGLQLSGSEFSIDPDYRVTNDQSCASGKFANGLDGGGDLTCATPGAAALQTAQARQTNFLAGDGVPDDGAYHTMVSLGVAAGTYLVNGKGVIDQGDDDTPTFSTVGGNFGCRLGNLPAEFVQFYGKDNDEDEYPFALAGIVTTSGENVTIECFADNDNDLIAVRDATLTAVKIG